MAFEYFDWIYSMRVKGSAQPIVLSTPTVHSDGMVVYLLFINFIILSHAIHP